MEIKCTERKSAFLKSAGRFGGRWLFALAGVLFFLFLSGISSAFVPAQEPVAESLRAVEYPDSPEEALRSNPFLPLQNMVRTARSQRLTAPFKIHPAALPVPAVLPLFLILPLFWVRLEPQADHQTGLSTSILVRAGPLCFEKNDTFFQNNKYKEFYDYEKEFGIHYLLWHLCTSRCRRDFCLQNDFLRVK